MRYAKINADYFCGIDFHARTMYVCVMSKMGEIVFQRNMKNDFKLLLQVLETHLSSIAVGWSHPSLSLMGIRNSAPKRRYQPRIENRVKVRE